MMEKRSFCFAGVEIEIAMPEELLYTNEYRLAPFRTNRCENPHKMIFRWVDELSPPIGVQIKRDTTKITYENVGEQVQYIDALRENWADARFRVSHKGRVHEAEVKRSAFAGPIAMKMVLECMDVASLLLSENACILHCSYIQVDGQAILFTAPSETGKSTQADLWKEMRGAEIINGDRAAIRRIKDGEGDFVIAEGIPYAGSSDYCNNKSLPVKAIVYLEQAPVTSIRKLSGSEAFSAVWKGCFIDPSNISCVEVVSGIVSQTVKTIPVFLLSCTPDESAVKALEWELSEHAKKSMNRKGGSWNKDEEK